MKTKLLHDILARGKSFVEEMDEKTFKAALKAAGIVGILALSLASKPRATVQTATVHYIFR